MVPTIRERKAAANIRDVWCALGGGKLRGHRGQAFWRGGSGYSVALDPEKGLWFDHRNGVGGDSIALVMHVRQCSFRDAARWLADFAGVRSGNLHHDHDEEDSDWRSDLRAATWWAEAVQILAEDTLAELPPWHSERRGLTQLLRSIRLGEASMVAEFRSYRQRHPKWAAGLVCAGRLHDAALQRKLALWLRKRYVDGKPAA